MKNAFFDIALGKASKAIGSRARMLLLIAQLGAKLKSTNWKNVKSADVKERLFVFGRLLKAFVKGKYTSIPWKPILLIAAAVIYFINPADLIPDWLVAIGFTDDAGILMMVYASVKAEIEKFIAWENTQLPAPSLEA
jgi:uncharacterized membrane protein YkvA (DUF1232 family)